jgi:hypothetical protein
MISITLTEGDQPSVVLERARAKFSGSREANEVLDYLQQYIRPVEEYSDDTPTYQAVAQVFQEALRLVEKKTPGYGRAWQEQGWMGNLARIMSKSSRLKNMLWRGRLTQFDSAEETTEDTALDMMNLLAFFLINKRIGNEWGGRR